MLNTLPKALVAGLAFAGFTATSLADTLLYKNVNGYTLNSERDVVRFAALEVNDDVVVRTYAEGDTLPADDTMDTVIDGAGRTLVTGLIDAHGHVLSYGQSLLRVDLVGTSTEAEAAERVAAFAEANEELEWVLGRGWNQVLWDSNAFPTAASLDALVAEKPIWLSRVDGHAGWANSKAMEIAGVTRDTPDPDGGQILRDADGNPTGVFVDNAMALVRGNIPPATLEEQKFALMTAMKSLATYGLTAVHDAGVSSSTVAAYKQLLEDGPLPIRVNVMLGATDPLFTDRLAEGHFSDADQTLTINSVKIAADGALGSRGAAMIDDYSDMPGHKGLILLREERMQYLMRAAMNSGFQVNTHAIGDAANKLVLDSYEQLIARQARKICVTASNTLRSCATRISFASPSWASSPRCRRPTPRVTKTWLWTASATCASKAPMRGVSSSTPAP
jgi:predicted amidohydrolase YtcJ